MPFTQHLTFQGSHMPHEFWNMIRNLIKQANKKSSKMWARGKSLELLHRSTDAKMFILEEEKLKTSTILIKKIDLIYRIRSHLEASTISEHLYNPHLSSILALLRKLRKLNRRISPPQNGGGEVGEHLSTIFLAVLFIELLFLYQAVGWMSKHRHWEKSHCLPEFLTFWGIWYGVLLCKP